MINHPSRQTSRGLVRIARDHCNDSNMEDGIGFEDFPIVDLETFIEQGAFDQQDVPTKRMEVPLHGAPLAAVEHPDAVVTAITSMHSIPDGWIKVMPIQSITTSLASLLCNLKEDWVRVSIRKGVEVIIGIISNHGSPRDLLASRA